MDIRLVFLLFSSFVSACNNDGMSSAALPSSAMPVDFDDPVNYHAQIETTTLTIGSDAASTSVLAVFSQFQEPASATYVESFFGEPSGCVVERHSISELNAIRAESNKNYPISQFVSAGDLLTIMTPEGSWSDLTVYPALYPVGTYESDSEEFLLLPSGSVLNVPGDSFPVLSDVVIVVAEPLTNVRVTLGEEELERGVDTATKNTTFHWDASTNANSRMTLWLQNVTNDSEGGIADISSVLCNVADTGFYSIPLDIRELMDDAYTVFGLQRDIYHSEKRGDVLVTQHSSSHLIR